MPSQARVQLSVCLDYSRLTCNVGMLVTKDLLLLCSSRKYLINFPYNRGPIKGLWCLNRHFSLKGFKLRDGVLMIKFSVKNFRNLTINRDGALFLIESELADSESIFEDSD